MWANILLDDRIALSIVRYALQEKHVSFAHTTNEYEAFQVSWLRRELQGSRAREALRLALFADQTFLDGARVAGWELAHEPLPPVDEIDFTQDPPKTRPILETQSDSFRETFVLINSIERAFDTHQEFASDPERAARNLGCLEPLIWRSYRRERPDITPGVIHAAVNLIVLYPELITLRHTATLAEFTARAVEAMEEVLKEPWETNAIEGLGTLCSKVIIKGQSALGKVTEAASHSALYPVRISLDRTWRSDLRAIERIVAYDKIVTGVRLFLRELQYIPHVETLTDVFRIRSDPRYVEFRSILQRWINAIAMADSGEIRRLRSELFRANQALRTAFKCERIARFFTYVGLPLIAVDAVLGPIFGASATIAGVGVQAYADWRKSRFGWALVGR